MGQRRHREYPSLERVMGLVRKKKKNGNGRPQIPKSPTHMRFFEQSEEQRETAAQVRSCAEEIFDKGTESPKAVSSYHDLIVGLFEEGADRKPRKSSRKTPGNRQPGRKKRDREMREERRDARERKTA